jgi:tRNA-specific adenosine deaminase 1
MELIMAAQDDASPWDISLSTENVVSDNKDGEAPMPGRAYFSQLGVVRRKPARGDAPQTLSKSCSDKMALKQCTSLLSSMASLLISPRGVYLESLVLPEARLSTIACNRSFSRQGRMASMEGRSWGGEYAFTPFRVQACAQEFAFSQRMVMSRAENTAASNMAAAWTANGLEEGLVGGALSGCKQFHAKSASSLSRRKMWGLVSEVARLLEPQTCHAELDEALHNNSYEKLKGSLVLEARRKAKGDARSEALKGWTRNTGDDEFGLDIRSTQCKA